MQYNPCIHTLALPASLYYLGCTLAASVVASEEDTLAPKILRKCLWRMLPCCSSSTSAGTLSHGDVLCAHNDAAMP